MDSLGTKIKYIREQLGRLTQEELGEKLGISKQNVSNYENNLAKPNIEFLSKLNTELNVNLNWLIADNGQPFNPPPFADVEDEFIAKVRKILHDEGLIK